MAQAESLPVARQLLENKRREIQEEEEEEELGS